MDPSQLPPILEQCRSAEVRNRLARQIKAEQIDLNEYIDLLYEKHPIGMRFTWVLGEVCEKAPELIAPALPRFFEVRGDMKFPGYDRSIAKWFWLCGIPEEIEGEVVEQLFEWMLDPKIKVAVKVFSMSALADIARKYPELGTELRLIIEEQFEDGSAGYKSRGRKVLAKLEKISPRQF